MAAEEGTVHHEDWEWEAQRENFTKYYKTESRTLKEAARCMIDVHNFSATLRQWERKVNLWGLQKYTSRHDRLKQIEAQGRSIHEVARPGRRPRAYEPGLLHPERWDERNIRRFARRELNRSGSRSRSRSRSNSFGQRSRSATPLPEGEYMSDQVIVGEDTYGLDFTPVRQARLMHVHTSASPISVPAVPVDHETFGAQAHVLQLQDTLTGETSDELFLTLPEQSATQDTINHSSTLDQSQYDFAELDHRYSIDGLMQQQGDMEPPSPFPVLDTDFDGQTDFMSSQNVPMEDISPTFNAPQNSAWMPQPTFAPSEIDVPANFMPETAPRHQSFQATPTSETGTSQNFPPSTEPLDAPDLVVPELVIPPASPNPSSFDTSRGEVPYRQANQSMQQISHPDQQIYADFYASVNRFTQAVSDAVLASVAAADDKLNEAVTLQRSTFISDMTMTLNNFVRTQQRAVQSIHQQCDNLKQQRNTLQLHKQALEQENMSMKQIVQQIPGAAEQMAPPHRFSLPGNYVFGGQPPIFTSS